MVVLKSYHTEPNAAHHWIWKVLGYMLVLIKRLYPFLDSLYLLTKCALTIPNQYQYYEKPLTIPSTIQIFLKHPNTTDTYSIGHICSVVPGATVPASRGPLKGTMSAQKAFHGSETESRELLEERKRIVFPRRGVIDLHSKQINYFFTKRKKLS